MIATARREHEGIEAESTNPLIHGVGANSAPAPVDTGEITRAWARKTLRDQRESMLGLRRIAERLRHTEAERVASLPDETLPLFAKAAKAPPPIASPRRKVVQPKATGWGKTTKSKGVYVTAEGRYAAKFRHNFVLYYVGTFDTEIEARKAVVGKRKALGLKP